MKKEPEFLIIPDPKRLRESAALAEETGAAFEYNDFYWPQVYREPDEVERRIARYRALARERSLDTLHGVFFDVNIASCDATIKNYSRQLMRQSAQIAEKLGIRGVVFHTGLIENLNYGKYRETWLAEAEETFRALCREFPGICFYVENTFENTPEVFVLLAERMRDVSHFALCLDYAHAVLTATQPRKWIEALSPYIGHIHINDNDLKKDLHRAVGDGCIDFTACKRLLEEYRVEAPILLELNGIEEQRKSLSFMKRLFAGGGVL